MSEQRRGLKIAMSVEERDSFLSTERTCRVASIGHDGSPHVTPLWFAWDGTSLWLTSIVKSQRWTDLQRDPRVSIGVDTGDDFMELRGVELKGRAVPVGEIPRTGEPCPSSRCPNSSSPTSTPADRWATTAAMPGCASHPNRSSAGISARSVSKTRPMGRGPDRNLPSRLGRV